MRLGVLFVWKELATRDTSLRGWCVTERKALCVGASGTGRTTFVNTLCESEVLQHKVCDSPEATHLEEGIKIKPVNVGM